MYDKVVKIGIISKDDYKKRTLAIAGGEYEFYNEMPKRKISWIII